MDEGRPLRRSPRPQQRSAGRRRPLRAQPRRTPPHAPASRTTARPALTTRSGSGVRFETTPRPSPECRETVTRPSRAPSACPCGRSIPRWPADRSDPGVPGPAETRRATPWSRQCSCRSRTRRHALAEHVRFLQAPGRLIPLARVRPGCGASSAATLHLLIQGEEAAGPSGPRDERYAARRRVSMKKVTRVRSSFVIVSASTGRTSPRRSPSPSATGCQTVKRAFSRAFAHTHVRSSGSVAITRNSRSRSFPKFSVNTRMTSSCVTASTPPATPTS